MGRRKHIGLKIQGQTFLTAQEAAQHLGCCEGHVLAMLEAGRADRIGMLRASRDRAAEIAREGLTVRGEQFASIQAVASHFKVTRAAVWRHIHGGTLDRIGLRAAPSAPVAPPGGGALVVRGEVFASAEEIAAHFGLDLYRVRWMIRAGRMDAIGRRSGIPARRAVSGLVLGGARYGSEAEAEAALDLAPGTIAAGLAGDAAKAKLVLQAVEASVLRRRMAAMARAENAAVAKRGRAA